MTDDARARAALAQQELDRLTDRHGRLRLHNPARPGALLGLALGVLVSAGCALAGRGGETAAGVLQLALALGVVVAVVALLLSLALGGLGRRAAVLGLGLAVAALVALLVLGLTGLVVDTGLPRS